MKKAIKIISIFFITLNSIFLISCKSVDFSSSYAVLENFLGNVPHHETMDVTYLDAYYNNNDFYFNVEYVDTNSNEEYNILYIIRGGHIATFFPLTNEADVKQYFSNYYDRYLIAKEKGVHKEYTEEDIIEFEKSINKQ